MTRRLAALPALAAALAAASPALAAAPWEGAPFAAEPAALAAAAAALPPRGAPLDVLAEEGTFRFDRSGAVTFTYRLVARPLTPEAARAYDRVERTWVPWHQARPEIRARVVGPAGEVSELEARALAETGGEGRRAVSAPLPSVRAGSVIEELTVVRDTAPAFEAGVTHRFWFGQGGPARLVRLTVIAPEALPIRFAVRGADLAPRETRADGLRTWTFERRDVPAAAPPEPAAPREVPAAPYVAFGWGRSWQDVAARYGKLVDDRLRGEDLAQAARGALGAGASPGREEAVRRLVSWAREQVRATGPGLGEARAPQRPSETLARRAGGPEDLALLVTGLLRAAGYDARVALAASGWQEPLEELPGLGLFDRALVRVEGKPALWIDPADPFAPAGVLPPALQGRLALVAGQGARPLVTTPESAPADNTVRTTREILLADLGLGRVVETRELRGALAAAERAFRARIAAAGGGDLEARYAREVLGAEALVGADVSGLEDPAAPVRIRLEADRSAAVETRDDDASVPASPDAVFEPLPPFLTGAGEAEGAPEPAPRRADVLLPVPYRAELAYRVVPPDGFRARSLPPNARETFGPASLERTFRLEPDGAVTALFVFDTGGRRLAARDATALGRRVRALARERGPRVAFERTAAALIAAGKVPEGLAELRRLLAAQPRRAMHRLHLAVSLVQLGYRDAAAGEARAAIGLEPSRAWAHRVLGFVLEHDAVGRVRGPGFDRAGALEAYRRAAELDPRHAGVRAALADLLATAPSGLRHAPGADLPAAIAAFRAIRDDLGDRGYDAGLLAALLAAGRDAEAAALARELPAGPERNAVLVAAAAAGGVEAALAAAPEGEARRAALRDGAQLLVRRRRYAPAAALAAEAARGAPNAAEQRAQADTFAALRPWKPQLDEGDEAARLVKRLLAAAVVEAEPERAALPLLAARTVETLGRDGALAALPLPIEPARRAAQELGAGPDVFLDLVLSRLELVADGDAAQGLRVRLRFPHAAAERGSTVFLVREGGKLRLLGTDLAWPLLGGEALRLAGAGDLAGARRWLGWAREALRGGEGDPASPAAILAALLPPGAPGDGPALRRAAAALLAHGDRSGRTLPALAEAERDARTPAERRSLRFAAMRAARHAGRLEEALGLARALLAEDPASRDAFGGAAFALVELRRPAELEAAALAILDHLPGDPEVLSMLGSARLALGDLAGASRAWRTLVDAGTATPLVYNNAAWLELFHEAPGPATLDWARRAVDQDRERGSASQNTLAAVLATLGRPAEARDLFLASLDGRPPGPADWYVFGRIAEAWGLADAARTAYGRVEEEKVDGKVDPSGAHVLARRRLEALGPAPSPPGQDAATRAR